jgi:HlyD family secretion protein
MRKKKRFMGIGLAVLLGLIVIFSLIHTGQGVEVETVRVVKGDLNEYVEETAVVQAEDHRLIFAPTVGQVAEVFRQAGDKVKAGDVLAKLDSEEILLQIEALEAQKQAAEAQYAEAKSPAGKEEIGMLKVQVKAAEASYHEAKLEADNSKTLYESGAISLDTYQKSLTRLAVEESNLERAKTSLTLAQKGASANVLKQLEGQINQIEAQIEILRKQINDLTIKAPGDGIILFAEAKAGVFVQPGSPLFEMGNDTGIFLESDILVDEVGDIKVGAAVFIENEDLGIKGLPGRVRKIYPKAFNKMSDLGIEQKRVKLEIDFVKDQLSNEEKKKMENLKPGYDLEVKIITAGRKNTLLVEESAVFDYQGKAHVFVVEKGKAKLREIEKGIESDEKVEVLKGLREGEEVIISPDETIEDGAKVK